MSNTVNNAASAPTADQLADQRILKQLMVCVLAMMGVAVAIVTTANIIA